MMERFKHTRGGEPVPEGFGDLIVLEDMLAYLDLA
jgi:hypothetical protein